MSTVPSLKKVPWLMGLRLAAIILLAVPVMGYGIPSSPDGHIAIVVTVALLTFFAGFSRAIQLAQGKPVTWFSGRWEIVCAVLSAALILVIICKLGMIQFGAFDHSALIDLGWRMALGQKPYTDFPCTMPPAFYLGAGLAFKWLGVKWSSLVLVAALYGGLTFLWLFWLLRKTIAEPFLAWLLAVFVQVVTMVLVSYWWYNPVTTVSGVLYFLSAWLLIQSPGSWPVRISYVLSITLLAFMKPNIAGLLIIGSTFVSLCTKQRWQVLALSFTGFLLFLGTLTLAGISLIDVVSSYLGIAQRGTTLEQFLHDLSFEEKVFSVGTLFLTLLPTCLFLPGNWQVLLRDKKLWLAGVAFLAGLYGFLTNGELKPVDMPLMVLASYLYVCAAVETANSKKKRMRTVYAYYGFLLLVLTGVGLGQAATRHRVKTIGYGSFFEYQLSDKVVPNPFFNGLRAGNEMVETVNEVSDVLQKNPDRSLYFGPRMQWCYAAFNLSPPLHQPSWWHPGVSFALSQESFYQQNWLEQDFELVILLKNDVIYFSREFINAMIERYSIDQSYPELTVLYHKHQP